MFTIYEHIIDIKLSLFMKRQKNPRALYFKATFNYTSFLSAKT